MVNDKDTVDEGACEPKPFMTDNNPNDPRKAIKHGSAFLIVDEYGLMPGESGKAFGFYRDDTRWLSKWDIRINGVSLSHFSLKNAKGEAVPESLWTDEEMEKY